MSRGILKKVDIEAILYKFKNQLDKENFPEIEKQLANKYLNKVLDKIKEYRE